MKKIDQIRKKCEENNLNIYKVFRLANVPSATISNWERKEPEAFEKLEKRAKDMCDIAFEKKEGTYAHIAIEEMSEVISAFDIHKRREELIQLTAVCVAWIEKIDRDLLTGNYE